MNFTSAPSMSVAALHHVPLTSLGVHLRLVCVLTCKWSCAADWCPFRRILGGADEQSTIRSADLDDAVAPKIVDLAIETVLRIFTLSADNLLVGAAKCAGICPMWWLALRGTTACGHGLLDRATVLRKIGRALGRDELYHDGHVQLSGVILGDAGAKMLGAGLSALPVARTALHSGPQVLDLRQCDVSTAGMTTIAEAMV
jgi:hypothetical protein